MCVCVCVCVCGWVGGGDCHCPQYRGLVANKEEIVSDIRREDSVTLRLSLCECPQENV